MSKVFWNGGTLLAPVPPALVSCGTVENPNCLTVAWTGIINTKPPMTYISVRPVRHSYNIIKDSGEFVINLTTSSMCKVTDFCGVKTGAKVDKFQKCGFTAIKGQKVDAPMIGQCPVSIECVVKEIKPLGTHDMFISEIVGVNIDEKYISSKGKLNLQQCGLMAYAHGEYFALGRKLGEFGWSVRKKKKKQ